MASWQAYVVAFLMRWKVKRRLARNLGSDDVDIVRDILAETIPEPARGVLASSESVGGVAGEWSRPGAGTPDATMLYVHGGGFIACSNLTHRPITNGYALRGFDVFAPNYGLAPENPAPAGIEDCVAAYRGLLAKGVAPNRLVVAGDSAGGSLVLSMLLTLRDAGDGLPAAAMLFSPWTDLACEGASLTTNSERCSMFSHAIIAWGAKAYLSDRDPKTPLLSPLYADLTGLPPIRVHASTSEVLLDDSTRLVTRARAAGVACGLRLWPIVPHVWQLFPFVPEARESMDAAADFLKETVRAAGRR